MSNSSTAQPKIEQFFVSGDTKKIYLDDTYWVEIKEEFSVADHDKLSNRFLEIGFEPANREERRKGIKTRATQNVKIEIQVLLEIALVDWNFPDPDDPKEIAPLTPESILLLHADLAQRIYKEIEAINDPLKMLADKKLSKPLSERKTPVSKKRSSSTRKPKGS